MWISDKTATTNYPIATLGDLFAFNARVTLSTRAPRSGVPARLGVRVMRLVSCELPCALAFACEAGANFAFAGYHQASGNKPNKSKRAFDKPFEQ